MFPSGTIVFLFVSVFVFVSSLYVRHNWSPGEAGSSLAYPGSYGGLPVAHWSGKV